MMWTPGTITAVDVRFLELNVGQMDGLPKNPRQWTEKELKALAQSLDDTPELFNARPVLAYEYTDGKLIVLGGNMRLTAAKSVLGWSSVPTYVFPMDTPLDKLREIVIKDNGAFGAWDFDMLANEWDDLPLSAWGVPAWNTDIQDETPTVVDDDFDEENETVEPVCQRGDIWQLGNHRLMCGDSTDANDVAVLLDGVRPDLLMTDPPYGINADKMTMGTGAQNYTRGEWDDERPDIAPLLSVAEYSCVWGGGGNYFADVLPVTNDWLCWWKKNDGLSFSEFELAWTNYDCNCRHIAHCWGGEKKQHITMKPLDVISWAIQLAPANDVVFDAFGGSGTTLIACEQLNRKCFMMEIDAYFCDVIIARWEKLTGAKAVKL